MQRTIAIVTGANSGIGKATARGLAQQGFEVILAVRDQARGEAARSELAASVPAATFHVRLLDLGSQTSIRSFVRGFEAEFDHLDVLVDNAGLVPATRTTTADGHETQFAVNHLGPFLLTLLLLPRLEAATAGRIVVVSSSVHRGARLDLTDLDAERSYGMNRRYAETKLMNVLFVRALARRLAGTRVTVNALHPGVVATELARDFPAAFRWLARWLFTTPEKGARTSIWLASSPEVAGVSGRYFADRREQQPGRAALDDALAEQLWTASARLTGADRPLPAGFTPARAPAS